MYLPDQFNESSAEQINALVERYPLGTLITVADGSPCANHLPFILDPARGARGRLLCHMARANPQWHHLAQGSEVLVTFQGPDAYVSPAWYGSPGVPTWNFAVVQMRGTPTIIESDTELEALLRRQTHVYESQLETPWEPTLTAERRAKLLGMIVGIEIDVTAIQAKFKLSQNRSAEDRQRVVQALRQSHAQHHIAVAALMSAKLDAAKDMLGLSPRLGRINGGSTLISTQSKTTIIHKSVDCWSEYALAV